MVELPPLGPGDFADFFRAIHGVAPFPWQERLAMRLAEGQPWPALLDLPTGVGKTAALDVAVFQLALQADATARAAARRILYVVDRRTIVDQAYERAELIRAALEQPASDAVRAVATRLAALSREGEPLRTAVLRGGIPRDDLWARSPDQPLVAVSTVDQVGSRLLFRGYGVSDSMKPVHAGLLGNDVLYLLDEVHLSRAFADTLEAVGGRYRAWCERDLASPFAVVRMSATPGEHAGDTFRLTQDDERDPLITRRLAACKWTSLVKTTRQRFVDEVVRHAAAFATEPGAVVGVVVNRVASAREVHDELRVVLKSADVQLLTGRMRPADRERIERELVPRVRAGRVRTAEGPPLVVVSTQTIEAGADFDFDALVTECASLDALRQRFGRLDRLGERGESHAVVIARADTLEDDPVYGTALGSTWNWLESRAVGLDLGTRGTRLPDTSELASLVTPTDPAPILLPGHIDSWVQTSPPPQVDPEVALWLHGPERGTAEVHVVWRADLDPALFEAEDHADPRTVRALGTVTALPPTNGEAVSVPLRQVRAWLAATVDADGSDVEGEREIARNERPRDRETTPRDAVLWRGEDTCLASADRLRPGDTVVVPAAYGGYVAGTWDPAATAPVPDVAELSQWAARGRAMLRLHPAVVAGLLGDHCPSPPLPIDTDGDDVDDRTAVEVWLDSVPDDIADPRASVLLRALRNEAKARRLRVERIGPAVDGVGGEYLFVYSLRRFASDGSDVSTEDDRASFIGVSVGLDEHLAGVRDFAADFGSRLGLPGDIAADVCLAARWHDAGKVDPRFQRFLHGGSEFKVLVQPEPLAKTSVDMRDARVRTLARRRSGYPLGARHELSSVALMEAAEGLLARANDRDLVLHLVASHHGRCRPFAPWAPDPSPVPLSCRIDGVASSASSDHGLARLDSGVAERFWRLVRRYGWWGLAWLEAILRLADHRRSEWEQRQSDAEVQ